jgi:hypothetical protein
LTWLKRPVEVQHSSLSAASVTKKNIFNIH